MNEKKIVKKIIDKAYEIEKQGRNQEIKVKEILNYTKKLVGKGEEDNED